MLDSAFFCALLSPETDFDPIHAAWNRSSIALWPYPESIQ